ncbi:TetR/AcrR family transcriptional regulator [Macromonas nakdongensis]|uniref:TetR/AcrR family transcriptional regulator n=1 Tax=Macromonas nakdongensis TaxID=1843082 RepID=UPI0018E354E1|nr:TetR/AcrR family transcriptional regulator [Macromonas nakdongensis]
MTRERSENYDDKKELILRKAAALFAAKGYEITTMMDVAKACNASKSHLYHYFPAKEDLLYAIVKEHTTMLLSKLSHIQGQSAPALQRFERFVAAFVEVAADSRNEQLVLTNELGFLPPAKHKEMLAMEQEVVAMLIGLLQEINPQRMARVEVQTPYALLLFGMIIWTFTWYKKSGALKPTELAQHISDLFLNGFRAVGPA